MPGYSLPTLLCFVCLTDISSCTEKLPEIALGEYAHLAAALLDSGALRHDHHVIPAAVNPLWSLASRLRNLPGILTAQILHDQRQSELTWNEQESVANQQAMPSRQKRPRRQSAHKGLL